MASDSQCHLIPWALVAFILLAMLCMIVSSRASTSSPEDT